MKRVFKNNKLLARLTGEDQIKSEIKEKLKLIPKNNKITTNNYVPTNQTT